jgi:hypothetical protein
MTSHINLGLRATLLAALAACALLAVGVTGATADKRVKLTGVSTTITPSSEATKALTANGVTVTPITPATASNGSVTLPIARGMVNPSNLRGYVVHKGGLKLSKGTASVSLRTFVIRSTGKGAFLSAATSHAGRCAYRRNGHRHFRSCTIRGRITVARLLNAKRTDNAETKQTTVTADLKLTREAARAINRRLHQQVVKPGAALGTASILASAS